MTDIKTPLKTPYLDEEIKTCEFCLAVYETDTIREEHQEYQSIKEALKRLEKLEEANNQLKAERDELKSFVYDFLEAQDEHYGNATNTHLKMIDLSNQAQELLKEKE